MRLKGILKMKNFAFGLTIGLLLTVAFGASYQAAYRQPRLGSIAVDSKGTVYVVDNEMNAVIKLRRDTYLTEGGGMAAEYSGKKIYTAK